MHLGRVWLCAGTTSVPDDYLERSVRAELCFHHQRVYDMDAKQVVPLTPLPGPTPTIPAPSWRTSAPKLTHSLSMPAHLPSSRNRHWTAAAAVQAPIAKSMSVPPREVAATTEHKQSPPPPSDVSGDDNDEITQFEDEDMAAPSKLARSATAPHASSSSAAVAGSADGERPVAGGVATSQDAQPSLAAEARNAPTVGVAGASRAGESKAKPKQKNRSKGGLKAMFLAMAKTARPRPARSPEHAPQPSSAPLDAGKASDEHWNFVGPPVSADVAVKLACGSIHPVTRAPYPAVRLDPNLDWDKLGESGSRAAFRGRTSYAQGRGSRYGGRPSAAAPALEPSAQFTATSSSFRCVCWMASSIMGNR